MGALSLQRLTATSLEQPHLLVSNSRDILSCASPKSSRSQGRFAFYRLARVSQWVSVIYHKLSLADVCFIRLSKSLGRKQSIRGREKLDKRWGMGTERGTSPVREKQASSKAIGTKGSKKLIQIMAGRIPKSPFSPYLTQSSLWISCSTISHLNWCLSSNRISSFESHWGTRLCNRPKCLL